MTNVKDSSKVLLNLESLDDNRDSKSNNENLDDSIDIISLSKEQLFRGALKYKNARDFSEDCRRILIEPSAINFVIFDENCDYKKIQDEQTIGEFLARDNSIVDIESSLRQKSFLAYNIEGGY